MLLAILKNIGTYVSTLFISILPFIEAKGAIPIGVGLGLKPVPSFFVSYLGSLIPVLFLLNILAFIFFNFFIKKLSKYFDRKKDFLKKKDKLGKLSSYYLRIYTLFFFVAVPLPGTGVWSGSVIASILKLKKNHAFYIIAAANLFSSFIVFLLTYAVATIK